MFAANHPVAAYLETLAQRFAGDVITAQDLDQALTEVVAEVVAEDFVN